MKKIYVICSTVILTLGCAFFWVKNTLATPDFQKLYTSALEESPNAYDAFQELHNFAIRGEAEAQFYLGAMYEKDQDYPHAREWYTKAAEQNNVDALYNLGLYYEKKSEKCTKSDVLL